MVDLAAFLDVLNLEERGPSGFTARSLPLGGDVVFGGQLLAQTIVAAASVDPEKEVAEVHAVFARAAAIAEPLLVDLDVVAAGRSMTTVNVAVGQGERTCVQSIVRLSAPDPDLIRHQPPRPDVGDPADATASSHGAGWWEIRFVDGVDLADATAVGPPTLDVWTRFPGAPSSDLISRALLAFATDGFMIGTALRPHEGFGQAGAHREFATTVLSHTIRFHDTVSASQWHLIRHDAAVAGRGRIAGHAQVFAEDGRFVASFSQESLVRAFPKRPDA